MPFIKYTGSGIKTISKIGTFTSDTPPKKISDEVAFDYDNPKQKALGWIVIKDVKDTEDEKEKQIKKPQRRYKKWAT